MVVLSGLILLLYSQFSELLHLAKLEQYTLRAIASRFVLWALSTAILSVFLVFDYEW